MDLEGLSLIGSKGSTGSKESQGSVEADEAGRGGEFSGVNPATGLALEPRYRSASTADLERAATLAARDFPRYAGISGGTRGAFLRHIASGLEAAAPQIIQRAHLETALPEGRLQGELARTANQLRLFAQVAEEGSWVDARLDSPDPNRKPVPKPALRSMLRPIGPVAVFGASNFPLAFSVAGGDTASALAAGNPVVFKAHPAHPGTSELVGCVIRESVRACGMPEGVFSLLFDAGVQVGAALAQHPAMQAVAFTGSFAGGTALMKLAASRPAPIPCYAEMGSVNPVFILPGALNRRGAAIAGGLQSSFTLGAGQFCTKPGLIFIPREPGTEAFLKEISDKVAATGAQTLLTERMARQFASAVGARLSSGSARLLAKGGEAEGGNGAALAQVSLWLADCEGLSGDGELAKEIFGPTAVLVAYGGKEDLLAAAGRLEGHLTATIHGDEAELAEYSELIEVLARKVGRVLFNSYPTGVEVGYATVHGGPFPATSDGRSTSVGAGAILRFARPVCFQDFPDPALPEALRSANPLGILRLVNGAATRGAA